MTRDEAIAYGKEQLEVFGGLHKEFIQIAIASLERKHGEWAYLGLDFEGRYMYQCSHCAAIIYEPEFLINYNKARLIGNRFNFCPNCGAEMRGGYDGHTN